MYKAVIFDLDGTLIDSMGIWAEVDIEFLNKRGIEVPEDLFDDMNDGNSFNDMAIYFKNKFNLSESLEEIKNEWTEMVYDHYAHKIKLKDHIREILLYLKEKNVRMAIGTSNSQLLTKAVLTANQVFELFEVVVAGCDDKKGKPNPDIFLHALDALNVKAEEALVIEDTFAGVMAARNAGIKVYSVYDKHSDSERQQIKDNSDEYFLSASQLFEKFREHYESIIH